MASTEPMTKAESTRGRILDAAEKLVLSKGYSGTSVDDILSRTTLTKGAFFYHFRSKGELAYALIDRFWQRDRALFQDLSRRARELAEDPLQEVLLWFKLFETAIAEMDNPPTSCLLASYLYEREQFDAGILEYIEAGLAEWSALLEAHLQPLIDWRQPRIPTTAGELAEFAISLIEGGFVLATASQDPQAVVRQSARFRQHLRLLFAA